MRRYRRYGTPEFLTSLFKTLTEHPEMTATQTLELQWNERGMLVSPVLGRQFSEYIHGGLSYRRSRESAFRYAAMARRQDGSRAAPDASCIEGKRAANTASSIPPPLAMSARMC